MKIVNGKAVFEKVTCWECEGTGKVTRYKVCPNLDKRMSKSCSTCGKTKEEHSHKFLYSYQEKCSTCGGEGTRTENRFDNDKDLVIQTLPLELGKKTSNGMTFVERCLGFGLVASATDYGRHWKLSDEEFLGMIKKELSVGFRQFCSYVDKDLNVVSKLVAIRKEDGYIVVPVWNNK